MVLVSPVSPYPRASVVKSRNRSTIRQPPSAAAKLTSLAARFLFEICEVERVRNCGAPDASSGGSRYESHHGHVLLAGRTRTSAPPREFRRNRRQENQC